VGKWAVTLKRVQGQKVERADVTEQKDGKMVALDFLTVACFDQMNYDDADNRFALNL
jgi:hypothetical protein